MKTSSANFLAPSMLVALLLARPVAAQQNQPNQPGQQVPPGNQAPAGQTPAGQKVQPGQQGLQGGQVQPTQLQAGMGADSGLQTAVQAAVTNYANLQQALAEVGLSQADLVQAGLLKNPQFFFQFRHPDRAGLINNTEYSVSIDLLDALQVALRRRVAGTALQAAQARLQEAVGQVIARTQGAWYDVLAQQQIVALEESVLTASQAATDLAQRQFEAGNISDLDYDRQKAESDTIRLELTQSRSDLDIARHKLAMLMGSDTPTGSDQTVPAVPAEAWDGRALEALALQNRGSMVAARLQPGVYQGQVRLARQQAGLGEVRLGFDREQETDGVTVVGPFIQFNLPIFNHNQGAIQTAQAQLQSSQLQLMATERTVRLEVQTALEQVRRAQQAAAILTNSLLPTRTRIVQLSLLHYNNMQLSVYQLLSDRQMQLETSKMAVQAQRDYWQSRSELTRAVGGQLPAGK